jgi:signal transduction histidine kinase
MTSVERDERTSSISGPRGSFRAYIVAVACVAITIDAKVLIDHYIGHGPPFTFFFLPVLIAAWYGGQGPGLLATALSALACRIVFLSDTALAIDPKNDVMRLALFIVEGALTSWLLGLLHAARATAEARMHLLAEQEAALRQAHAGLELRVAERTTEVIHANQALRDETTERKRVECAQRAAMETAEEANRAKSEFLANMSHEIRTPTNGILGMLDLAIRTQLNPRQHEFVSLAKSSAETLLRLLNDILDFSKIEAGRLEL